MYYIQNINIFKYVLKLSCTDISYIFHSLYKCCQLILTIQRLWHLFWKLFSNFKPFMPNAASTQQQI